MTDDSIQTRKQAAVRFLRLVVEGRVEEAFTKHVHPGGKHHNPLFPPGFLALQRAMTENHVQFPHKQLLVKNVL